MGGTSSVVLDKELITSQRKRHNGAKFYTALGLEAFSGTT
jgi:hypothetical protein